MKKRIKKLIKLVLRKTLGEVERNRLIKAIQNRESAIHRRNATISRLYHQRYVLREKVKELEAPADQGSLLTKRALDGAKAPQNLEGLTVEIVPDDGAGNPSPRK